MVCTVGCGKKQQRPHQQGTDTGNHRQLAGWYQTQWSHDVSRGLRRWGEYQQSREEEMPHDVEPMTTNRTEHKLFAVQYFLIIQLFAPPFLQILPKTKLIVAFELHHNMTYVNIHWSWMRSNIQPSNDFESQVTWENKKTVKTYLQKVGVINRGKYMGGGEWILDTSTQSCYIK